MQQCVLVCDKSYILQSFQNDFILPMCSALEVGGGGGLHGFLPFDEEHSYFNVVPNNNRFQGGIASQSFSLLSVFSLFCLSEPMEEDISLNGGYIFHL